MSSDDARALWENATGPLRDLPGVTGSTMMGLPCLRLSGAFFAAWDRRTGDLLVKLPAARVTALVDAGQAHSFAPAGRRFREWAAVPPEAHSSWPDLLDQAFSRVAATGNPETPD